MNRSLYVRGTMVEDGRTRDLVIVDGVVADAAPLPSREPDAVGWMLPGLADVHNHLSLASPAGDHEEPAIRVRASASVELAVGVLAIREPGSPDDASMLLAGEAGWPRVVTLADAGMPVTAAVGAGSWTARRWLGLACLEPGAPADLVLYGADPRADLDVLRRPAMIVIDGQVIESNAGLAMRD